MARAWSALALEFTELIEFHRKTFADCNKPTKFAKVHTSQEYNYRESGINSLSRDGRSKSIGQYKLKTLLSLLPLLYRFSEGYSECSKAKNSFTNIRKKKSSKIDLSFFSL